MSRDEQIVALRAIRAEFARLHDLMAGILQRARA